MDINVDVPFVEFDRRERRQERRLARRPRCCECREHIQDDECYEWDGELICPSCLEVNHQKRTEDYIVDQYMD